MVNGTPAPLYYVSPTQLNVQIPYETSPVRQRTLEVDTPYQSATTNSRLLPSGPGIFMFADGSVNPSKSGARGQVYTLFITGEGQVSPSLTTGTTPSSRTPTNRLPKPVHPYKLTIGGVDAPIQFIGIPSRTRGRNADQYTVPARSRPRGADRWLSPLAVSTARQRSLRSRSKVGYCGARRLSRIPGAAPGYGITRSHSSG